MVISCSTGTYRRTAADEIADQQETLQNYLDGKYHDWPNEAGVSDRTEAKPANYGMALLTSDYIRHTCSLSALQSTAAL